MSIHLLDSNAIYFHIPKTGGRWVAEALTRAGVRIFHEHTGGGHGTYLDEPNSIEGKFLFTFVREPFSFYKSYWAYRMQDGWHVDYLDNYCKSNNFETFLKNIIRNGRPWLTEFYEKFIGNPSKMNFIGRTRALNFDLIRVLDRLGENFNDEAIMYLSPINTSKRKPFYREYLVSKVLELEYKVLERYFPEDLKVL